MSQQSGPTVFAEVIALAAATARSRQQANPLSYTILLLLTDGAVTDVPSTKQALASAADAPLSIVIVGIGNADFSAMVRRIFCLKSFTVMVALYTSLIFAFLAPGSNSWTTSNRVRA